VLVAFVATGGTSGILEFWETRTPMMTPKITNMAPNATTAAFTSNLFSLRLASSRKESSEDGMIDWLKKKSWEGEKKT
jgi:hypothetical protein